MIAFWLVMLAVLLAASFIWLSSLNESLSRRLNAIENHAVSEAYLSQALNENASRCVAGSEQRVKALARDLGYEWKRTEAKEGWEKKVTLAEALKATWGSPSPFASALRTVSYDDIPKYTAERRKADRRKADDSLAKHMKPVCDECFKRTSASHAAPKKKPRRAH